MCCLQQWRSTCDTACSLLLPVLLSHRSFYLSVYGIDIGHLLAMGLQCGCKLGCSTLQGQKLLARRNWCLVEELASRETPLSARAGNALSPAGTDTVDTFLMRWQPIFRLLCNGIMICIARPPCV